ncbi:pyridoxamine 5'-phosphate oxidase family protein [Aliiglaciecola sp. CAU 1673]|uniref:pyridoxamine 5'-phosphate oxidase family protein n=1 Tax=Aliiglaciecola sp. CAU 1673 TaxID=3032595 RepID=UPI0023DA951E|nr:pyridoxamine 5'-phosphate oxidase family protein [Aliiglaciecola sp. CAU 1673]MDF2176739.1 pyridoxamine 5'-phosphate oxidase family protein [Aliiglaciecola sp. CAU 1673]
MSECPSPLTQVKRGRKRACYDLALANDIIDNTLLCHVAQNVDGQPVVTPTCHWRDGDRLYWHGHARARNVYGVDQQDVCINICQLDALVLARSAFHHSVNYRSVTVFGKAQLVSEESEKRLQLRRFVERVSPGRWPTLRPMTDNELMITAMAWIPIKEVSVKVRSAPPVDEEQDYEWPVWAGVLPLQRQWAAPLPDPRLVNMENYPLPQAPKGF